MTRKQLAAANRMKHLSFQRQKAELRAILKDEKAFGFRKAAVAEFEAEAIGRRTEVDGDGLLDHRNLRGGKINMGSLRATDLERAEGWAALENTFHHSITVVSAEPEQEFSALRPLARLPEGVKVWPVHKAPVMIQQDQSMAPGVWGVSRNRTVGA